MSGKRIIDGLKEAVSVARRETPAAQIFINGHTYIPLDHAAAEIARLRAEKEELVEALEPFVAAFSRAMDEIEQFLTEDGDPMREDDESATEIYACALSLKWGDYRRARAALSRARGTE